MKNLEDLANFPSENPNPVLRVTKEKVLYANKAGEELFNTNEGSEVPAVLKESVIKTLNTKEVNTTEIAINSRFFSFDIIPISEEGYVNVYGKDITEYKEVQKELTLERTNLINILNFIADGVYIVDSKYNIEYVNPILTKEFGPYEGKKCYNYFHAQEEVCTWCKNQEVFKGKNVRWEWYSFKNQKYYDLFGTPLKNIDGSLSKLEIFRDITAQKKMIEELQEKKLSLTNAQRIAHIGNWDWDIVKNELYWSDEIYRIFGLSQLEFEATYEAFLNTIHPDDRESVKNSVDEALNNNKHYSIDHRIVLPNGSVRFVHEHAEVTFDDEGKAIKMSGTVQDITDRKKAEEKFHILYDTIPDAIYIIDQETGKIVDVNKAAEKMYGYNREEWLQMKNTDVSTEPEKTKKATKKIPSLIPIRYHKKKNGTIFPLEIISASYTLNEQRLVIATGRDITERKKSEEELMKHRDHLEELVKERTKALKESETRHKMLNEELELILDHIEGLVFYKDIKNRFIWLNKYMTDAYKMKREDLIGKSMFELHPEEVAQTYWNDDLEVINSGKPKINIEEPWETADGLKWVLTTKIPYIDEKGKIKGIIGTSLDITDRKIAEIELQKSELTYREAYNRAEFYKDIFTHDINNILQNISSGIQLNEMHLNKPEKSNKIKRNIELIKSQIKRGANLVSNIRKLSKLSESEPLLFNVNCIEVLKKSIKYFNNAFREKNIKIEVQIIENNLKILANELLEDVFENILTNSINYNESEIIKIEVKVNKELREGINYIKIQFIDNGIGITDERKNQIFIRGYSEETSIHGMGLGLSLVKKIIDSYNGEIWMEDRVKGDYTKGNNCVILIPEVENNG